MKTILFTSLMLLSAISGLSQITYKGVAVRNFKGYKKGDSVTICGIKTVGYGTTFYFIIKNNNYLMVDSHNIQVNFPNTDIWNHIKFDNLNGTASDFKQDAGYRNRLVIEASNYYSNLENNGLIFQDRFIEDYLQQLLTNIYPARHAISDGFAFSAHMLNSDKIQILAFQNGNILISTQLLAAMNSENELYNLLTAAVASVIMDNNLKNFKNYIKGMLLSDMNWTETNVPWDNFAVVPFKTDQNLINTTSEVMRKLINTKIDSFKTDQDLVTVLSNVISYTAWQDYYNNKYNASLKLINRLIEPGLATDEDYLLMAKLSLNMSDSAEAAEKALHYLQLAEQIPVFNMIEINAQKGVALMRLGRFLEAQVAFEGYEKQLIDSGDTGIELKWCRGMIEKCKKLRAMK